MEMDIDWQIRPHSCMPMRTFLICSSLCSLSGKTRVTGMRMWFSEARIPPSVPSASRMRVCKGERIKTGYAIKLLHTRRRKCDPRGAHPPKSLCARYEASWMKNNVHTRSGTQLDSTSESRYVVSLTSSINIMKICSSKAASAATELTAEGCCCQKTWRRTLSRWLKIMQIWLTGFHCPVITTLCIYTAKLLENLIKSAQIGNESSWYVPPFTSSHYSVCVCPF